MQKTNKPVSLNTIHILKSIIDTKAKHLRAVADAGQRAAQEESEIYSHISSLQRFISLNRYDPSETREAELDLVDYEAQATAIRRKIDMGNAARQQLTWVDKFSATYDTILKTTHATTQIRLLTNERNEIERKMDILSERIFACEINCNPYERSTDVVSQSASDLEQYSTEYTELSDRMKSVCEKIAQLQQIR